MSDAETPIHDPQDIDINEPNADLDIYLEKDASNSADNGYTEEHKGDGTDRYTDNQDTADSNQETVKP